MVWAESRTAQLQGSKPELQCSVGGLTEMFYFLIKSENSESQKEENKEHP